VKNSEKSNLIDGKTLYWKNNYDNESKSPS